MRCEETATDNTGTDLHNGAQIPSQFTANTSARSARRKTQAGETQRVIEQTAEQLLQTSVKLLRRCLAWLGESCLARNL